MKPILLSFVLLSMVLGMSQFALAKELRSPKIQDRPFLLLDANTQTTLREVDRSTGIDGEILLPMLITMVARDEFSLDHEIIVTDKVNNESTKLTGVNGSLGLVKGEKIPMKDLFAAILVGSSSDALRAVIAAFPSEKAFLEKLQKKITYLKLNDTKINYIGPDANYSSSLKDATIVASAFNTYSDLMALASQNKYVIGPSNMVPESRTIETENPFATTEPQFSRSIPICFYKQWEDKTDLILLSTQGSNQFAYATSGAPRLATVTSLAIDLINWANETFQTFLIIKKDEIISSLPLSEHEKLPLKSDRNVFVLQSGPEVQNPKYSLNFEPKVETGQHISKGQKVGQADIIIGGEKNGTVSLIAAMDGTISPILNQSPPKSTTLPFLSIILLVLLALFFCYVALVVYRLHKYKKNSHRLKNNRTYP